MFTATEVRLLFRPVVRSLACAAAATMLWAAPSACQSEPYVAIGKYEEGLTGRQPEARSTDSLVQRYREAIADAEYPEPRDISLNLQAVTPWERGLIWDNPSARRPIEQRVLVVTWTSYTGYDSLVGQETTQTRDAWVNLAPVLRQFCWKHRASEERMTLRVEQLLGLPPYGGKTRFVEFWVSPQDLFRPSADPTITDHEAELDFPVSDLFMTVNPSYMTWFTDLEAISYNPVTGYPWTRLGYTYDWKPGTSKIGLSEFVIRAGARVGVNAVILNNDFFHR